MKVTIPPFSMTTALGNDLCFPGTTLVPPSLVSVVGNDGDDALALASCALGLPTTAFDIADSFHRRDAASRPRAALAVGYAGPQPRWEISGFWSTVALEVTLGQLSRWGATLADPLVAALGIEGLSLRHPQELSGGETARVAIAAQLASRPSCVILDHTQQELDVATRHRLAAAARRSDRLLLAVGPEDVFRSGQTWQIEGDRVVVLQAQTQASHTELAESAELGVRLRGRVVSDSSVLAADDVTIRRDGRLIFEGLSFRLRPGQIGWLLGPNGSGKTTFFEAVLQLVPGKSFDVQGSLTSQDGFSSVGYSPQDADEDITELTLREELTLASQSVHSAPIGRGFGYLLGGDLSPGLLDESLSAGPSVRKVGSVLAALCRSARLCFLDEPTLRVASHHRGVIIRAMEAFCAGGGAILASSHDSGLISEVHLSASG